jgi:hypothetical protein
VFLGVTLAIVGSETLVRILLPNWIPATIERVQFWQYDSLLGWAHTPLQQGRFHHRDFSVEVSINSHGMRDNEYSIHRTGKRRMLILGDSFGWGFGVEQKERFSELLEVAHPDWEIINASVNGYGTDQEFLLLTQRLNVFKPDMVLLLFCDNDFDENVHSEIYWHYKPVFSIEGGRLHLHNVPVPLQTFRQRLQRFLLGSTYLGPRLNSLRQEILRFVGQSVSPPADGQGREVTRLLLAEIIHECREREVEFLLVSVPMSGEKRELLGEISEEEQVRYLPLDPFFELLPSGSTFPHDGHWTALGHRIASTAIDDFVW